MKSILYLVSTIFISLSATVVEAQTPTPDAGSLGRFDRAPIQQPGVFSNPNSGSRQFFQQGRDNLYFLEEAEPILQIDGEIESEPEAEDVKIQEPKEASEPAE